LPSTCEALDSTLALEKQKQNQQQKQWSSTESGLPFLLPGSYLVSGCCQWSLTSCLPFAETPELKSCQQHGVFVSSAQCKQSPWPHAFNSRGIPTIFSFLCMPFNYRDRILYVLEVPSPQSHINHYDWVFFFWQYLGLNSGPRAC
jgi:hypothetical protein